MSQEPPSQARIWLLLIGSLITGMLVSTSLSTRAVTQQDQPLQLTEQSPGPESP